MAEKKTEIMVGLDFKFLKTRVEILQKKSKFWSSFHPTFEKFKNSII
jgi:hypothetical protein